MRRASRPCKEHVFKFAEIAANAFRSILPEDFTELHASRVVAIYACRRCNAFSIAPIGRDMPA
jgi:hypothetical protein